MKSNLTYRFILKAWLGHYITGRCALDLVRLKKKRKKAERLARAEAEHLERLSAMVTDTTKELYKKNDRLLAIAREQLT